MKFIFKKNTCEKIIKIRVFNRLNEKTMTLSKMREFYGVELPKVLDKFDKIVKDIEYRLDEANLISIFKGFLSDWLVKAIYDCELNLKQIDVEADKRIKQEGGKVKKLNKKKNVIIKKC
jgi:predicted DNA-binding ArsR family transcriptional regulator